MAQKATIDSLIGLLDDLSPEERLALTDTSTRPDLRRFLKERIAEQESREFATILHDDDPLCESIRPLIAPWRGVSQALGSSGPVVYRVRGGLSLADYVERFGSSEKHTASLLESWGKTSDTLVFFVPRLVCVGAVAVHERMRYKASMRQTFRLPEHHLTVLGKPALIAGLCRASARRTGERTPLSSQWALTDESVVLSSGDRGIRLSTMEHVLEGQVGFFPIGIELLPGSA